MKLKSVLNKINETKYMVVGVYESKYEDVYIKLDYLGGFEKYKTSLVLLETLKKDNPDVDYISFNRAADCIEIGIK